MEKIFLSENLKYIRKCYGISQVDMAKKLNTPIKSYQSYEEGRAEPKLACILSFGCILNLTLEDLLKVETSNVFTPLEVLQKSVKRNKNSTHY